LWNYSGGKGIYTINVEIGENTGLVTLTYEAFINPDRFQVFWGNDLVIDTGYVSTCYPNNCNTSPYFWNTQLINAGLSTVSGNSGSKTFNKISSYPTNVTVIIFAPFLGTQWSANLSCLPTPTPTPTQTETPTPTQTETPTPTQTETPTSTSTSTPTQTQTETPTSTSTSTPNPTPTNTPTQLVCTCFGLISDVIFSIDYTDCYGESQNAIAFEGFPGQWSLYVCAYSYQITAGIINEEFINDCFLLEEGWSCPQ
jgi:hypothetical protein